MTPQSQPMSELDGWKQAASVEASLRREFYNRALTAEARIKELEKALKDAIPLLETLHSLTPVGEARRHVFAKIKNARALVIALRLAAKPDEVRERTIEALRQMFWDGRLSTPSFDLHTTEGRDAAANHFATALHTDGKGAEE